MNEFMVMILADEAEEARLAPSELKARVEAFSGFERTLRAAGVYVDGERLRPSAEARRVRVRDGTAQVESGPFAEAPLGAYYVLRSETLEAAVALAQHFPSAPGISLDVRPVMGGALKPEKANLRGRVFAFAVLGNAPDERGWVEFMDRIDHATQDCFPVDGRLGGVRLEPPGRGRQVKVAGGQRAIFDGPFLESKEVIGGLFFLRMERLEDAVRWASQTEFVTIGAVEIRELWRS